jgi:DNA-binding CsgD family transcriptional regulator
VADGHWALARHHVNRALGAELDLEGTDQDLLPTLALAALLIGDLAGADEYHRLLLLRARRSNAPLYVVKALNRLTLTDIAAGRWTDVDLHAAQALALSEVTLRATVTAVPRAARLLVAALRADAAYDERLEELQQDATTDSRRLLDLVRHDLVHWAKGVRAEESPDMALHHLSNIRHPLTQRLAALERIEAAVRTGRHGTAARWVADIDEFGRATQQVWARAVAEHGRALLAEPRRAEEHFRRALQLHAGSPRVFDRARTQLALGQMLRRSRRRVDAREPLREAMQTFADLQADYWQDRAVHELRAAGDSPGPEPRAQVARLTPQERQVTTLVCQGLTNQDVAERLVLSRRTVDFHLRNVFAKTGVTSRLELTRLMLS